MALNRVASEQRRGKYLLPWMLRLKAKFLSSIDSAAWKGIIPPESLIDIS